MPRNDYMHELVWMKARASWTGREGKIKRGQHLQVPEWRARELEGYQRTQGRTMNVDGTTTEPGKATIVPARAVRLYPKEAPPPSTKGGPTPRDRKGQTDKRAPEGGDDAQTKRDQRDHQRERQRGSGATASAQTRAEELGLDVEAVPGSGANGRVTKPDVDAHYENLKRQPAGTGDPHLDRFIAELEECDREQLAEQRALYAHESDTRYVQAVDAEIERRAGEAPGDEA